MESDNQLRLQLEALYMQILSTLTLPSLSHIFSVRPSTDLSRPLQGSESLLSSLADSFTRGSPSTLLSALECLKIRKQHRHAINNALLKTKASSLLYGLLVAGGRLVSVIRPKKHSLHPGDLQLLFNMVFEADGVKAGGGESWIPVCLPGFNSSGYLYMYVSFLDIRNDIENSAEITKDESVAIVLISPDKEAFFEMQSMRESLVEVRSTGSSRSTMTYDTDDKPANGKKWKLERHQSGNREWTTCDYGYSSRDCASSFPVQISRQRSIHDVIIFSRIFLDDSTAKVGNTCFAVHELWWDS